MLRFDSEARAAITAAHELARVLGSRRLDTRHLLVAIAEAPGPVRDAIDTCGFSEQIAQTARSEAREDGLDAEALASLGIDLDAVRREAEATFGADALSGASRHPRGTLRLEPETKKALELARREAIRLNSETIGAETLALGILRADCTGRRVVRRCGIDVGALRTTLEA